MRNEYQANQALELSTRGPVPAAWMRPAPRRTRKPGFLALFFGVSK